MKKGLSYFAGLIALYIGVNGASGAGKLIIDGAEGASTFTRSLQGR